ncbi:BQ2448_5630 [Microbotryum intermedium]|uniref:triacylglycerol lipase n=1 Tax=Microbotryum intermedium TaxID=269621 RepID=A0A238F5C7_9BASI|nr:BQ2448_5630 [Microbotryum intermedium]
MTRASGVLKAPAPLPALLFPYPDQDPFYTQPGTLSLDKPGTIYKTRLAKNSGVLFATATQLLFRTVDALGNPTTSVTTVIKTPTSNMNYLVAYNMYEDAAWTGCAPSYCFNTVPNVLFCPAGDGNLAQIVSLGYPVVVTDFEGKTSGFSVGHIAGYQILDGYRAAINFLKMSSNVVIGGFGYSGGAIGTGWSAALHNVYAPELNIKALAFGGTPANVTETLLSLSGAADAGLAVAGVAGQAASYPELGARFQQVATAKGKASILQAQSQCTLANLLTLGGTNILSTDFQSLGAGFLTDPIVAKYLALGNLGSNQTETPTRPQIYMYHSSTDNVVPYAGALKAAQSWCQYGAKIMFTTRTGGTDHIAAQLLYSPAAITWLDSALKSQTPLITSCSFVTKDLFAP